MPFSTKNRGIILISTPDPYKLYVGDENRLQQDRL